MAIRDSLALDDGQRALRDAVRGLLTRHLGIAALRAAIGTGAGYSADLHARLTGELGLAGLVVPAEFGGQGRPQADAAVVHAELGRVLYPGPFLPGCLAAAALLAAGERTAQERWLPRLADGSLAGTVAAADRDGRWAPGQASVRADLTAQGWRLYGRRWYVLAAQVAGIIVVPAMAGPVPAVFAVEPGVPGLAASAQAGLDLTRRVSVVTFDAAPAVLLGRGQDAAAALDRAEREFLLATAAEAVGGISWCLDAAIAYAGDQDRPGRPAGSFQQVAGLCVRMLDAFQTALSAARRAAAAATASPAEARLTAHVAALRAGESYRAVTESAARLFAGTGRAAEQDAQLYYRRAWSAERLSGGPQSHRAAIAGRLV